MFRSQYPHQIATLHISSQAEVDDRRRKGWFLTHKINCATRVMCDFHTLSRVGHGVGQIESDDPFIFNDKCCRAFNGHGLPSGEVP
ncbi:hypothetical protein ABIE40_005647 [Rhizobium sp. OAE497]